MIDLHNHILPEVDDGARSVEESCRMAQALLAQGVTAVCATPHTTEWAQAGDEVRIRERVAALQRALAGQGIALDLLPGAEAHLTPTLVQDVQEHRVPTLNGTRYLLLEFPYDSLPPFYERIIFDLQVRGIRPILAHPERIGPIAEDPGILFELVRRGCLGQLTAMSLAGGFGHKLREVSELMLHHNLVHLVASDAHDAEPGGRLPALSEARAAAVRLCGPERAAALFEGMPASIVTGEPVNPEPPVEYKKRHGFLKAFR